MEETEKVGDKIGTPAVQGARRANGAEVNVLSSAPGGGEVAHEEIVPTNGVLVSSSGGNSWGNRGGISKACIGVARAESGENGFSQSRKSVSGGEPIGKISRWE